MKRSSVLLLIVLIIAIFFRLYHLTLTPPGLYPDEAMNGNNALQALATHNFKVFYPENNGREGLFMNIQAISIALLGNLPWVLRLPSAIFGILTVLGLYFLGKELYSKNIGLLAAFFLAVNFWHVNFSRIGFRAIMAPFLAIWAFYFLIVALRESALSRKKLIVFASLAGIMFGLGAYTYIAFRVMPVLVLILLLLYWLRSRKLEGQKILACSVFVLASVIVALPLLIYFLQNPADFLGRTSQISVFASDNPVKILFLNTLKTMGMFFFVGDGNWRHNFSGAPQLFWPVAIFFLAGIVLAIKNFSEEKVQNGFVFSWFILAMAPVVLSLEGIPHALRSLLLIPPTFLLAALGARWAYHFFRYRFNIKILNSGAFIVLLFIASYGYKNYFWDWANNPNVQGAFAADYVKIGEELNSLPKEAPKYVLVKAGGVLVNGIPMPAQTVMFITDTYTPEKQKEKNVHYVLPVEESSIPNGVHVFSVK